MPDYTTGRDQLREARAEFDRTIAELLRTACQLDPSYAKTYADFTKQTLVEGPKTVQ
jgi:hypothetical protein